MIVGGQRFPDTPSGYHYAARHVFKLGPMFYEDAMSLRDEAYRLEREASVRLWLNVVVVVAAILICAFHFSQ